MRARNSANPAQEIGVARLVTPHAVILTIAAPTQPEGGVEIELTTEDLIEFMTQCEQSLLQEVRYFKRLLVRKVDMESCVYDLLQQNRLPEPPL